jgi:hypothetical protein
VATMSGAGVPIRRGSAVQQGQHGAVEPASEPAADAVTGQRRPCRVAAAHPVHSATGMCAGAAQIQVFNRSLRPPKTWRGPEDQLLVQLGGTTVDGAAVQICITGLQIRGTLMVFRLRGRRNRVRAPRAHDQLPPTVSAPQHY